MPSVHCLSTMEVLTLVQTVILAATAVVVAIYTRETSRIRKQTDEQLAVARAALRPYFEIVGSALGYPSCTVTLRTTGGLARQLSTSSGDISEAHLDSSSVATFANATVRWNTPPNRGPVVLRMSCIDVLGNCFQGEIRVVVAPAQGPPTAILSRWELQQPVVRGRHSR
ncbi:MAG: hypothetical protein ACLQVM_24450 [Terriglobia bacterium]